MTTIDVDVRPFRVEITATTEVAAPAERTWAVLTDTAAYPDWNPFVRRLDGRLVPGERLVVDLQLDGDKAPQTMRPKVVVVEPGRRFAWLGRLGLPGLLDGQHSFTVEPLGGGSRLIQHEVLSGALVPVLRTLLTRNTPRGFGAANDALAARAVAGR